MLGAIAQFETELRAERQMDGITKAKARGVHFGRTQKLTRQQSTELRDRRAQGVLIKTLMRDYYLSKASVYRYLSPTDSPSRSSTPSLRNAPVRGVVQKSPNTVISDSLPVAQRGNTTAHELTLLFSLRFRWPLSAFHDACI